MWNMWMKTAMLGFEAQQVIWLRTLRMMKGGAIAEREARRMVSEKAIAAAEIGMHMLTRPSADAAVNAAVTRVRSKVRRNARRLTRKG